MAVTSNGWEAGVQATMVSQFGCCSASWKSEMKIQLHVMFRNWQVAADLVVFWHLEILGLCTSNGDFK